MAQASACCIAALIKRFLRELPADVWAPAYPALRKALGSARRSSSGAGVPAPSPLRKKISLALSGGGSSGRGSAADPDSEEELGRKLRDAMPVLPRRSADLIAWTCDVMSAVVDREVDNRMSVSAITAVMAPVLMRGAQGAGADAAADPHASLAAAQQDVKLCAALLATHREARLRGDMWRGSA